MPTQTQNNEHLIGHYVINREKLLWHCQRLGIENPNQLAVRLRGVVGVGTIWRTVWGENTPSTKTLYALTTLLHCRIDDICDAVPGEHVPPESASNNRSA